MTPRFFRWDRRHLDEIVAIEKASFTLPWSRDSFEEMLDSQAFDSFAIADEAGRVVGYVVICEVLDELQILNIAIHPEHRKKKYGEALLSYIHRHAYSRGRKESFLEVRENNAAAIALYEKFGYKAYMRRPNYYSDTGEDAILMRAELKA